MWRLRPPPLPTVLLRLRALLLQLRATALLQTASPLALLLLLQVLLPPALLLLLLLQALLPPPMLSACQWQKRNHRSSRCISACQHGLLLSSTGQRPKEDANVPRSAP